MKEAPKEQLCTHICVQGPALICTTCDAVKDVYDSTPSGRRGDLVYASNGSHLRFFAQNGISSTECTQALLYLSGTPQQTKSDWRLIRTGCDAAPKTPRMASVGHEALPNIMVASWLGILFWCCSTCENAPHLCS